MNIDLDAVARELSRETGASLTVTRDGLRDVLDGRSTESANAIKVYAELVGEHSRKNA